MAEKAAKKGARRVESQTLDLKLGLADIYSKLSRRVWRQRGEDLRAQATAKEWLDPSPRSMVRILLPRSTHIPRPNHVPATRGLLADHVCTQALCMRRSDDDDELMLNVLRCQLTY